MRGNFVRIITDLRETRKEVIFLRERFGIEFGDIKAGYEGTIEELLKLLGLTESEIDAFWELTEPQNDPEYQE